MGMFNFFKPTPPPSKPPDLKSFPSANEPGEATNILALSSAMMDQTTKATRETRDKARLLLSLLGVKDR